MFFFGLSYDGPILADLDCRRELGRLLGRFVVTVVDKATGNFAFTCHKLYIWRLAKEFGLDNVVPGNLTYLPDPRSRVVICGGINEGLLRFRLGDSGVNDGLALLQHVN